eukprot:2798900-Amphidinium_carterae.2
MMPSGVPRPVRLHPDWLQGDGLQVVGRCLDLTGAYKQFAVDPRSKHRGVAVPFRSDELCLPFPEDQRKS